MNQEQTWHPQGAIHFKEDVLQVSRSRFKTVILSESEESLPGERFFALAQNDKARWLVISNGLPTRGPYASVGFIITDLECQNSLGLRQEQTWP